MPSLPVTTSGRRHEGPRRTPTLVTWGGLTRAAGVPGVSDKVQLGAGFRCGGSPRAFRAWPLAWPMPSGPLGRADAALTARLAAPGRPPRAAVRCGHGRARRSRLDGYYGQFGSAPRRVHALCSEGSLPARLRRAYWAEWR